MEPTRLSSKGQVVLPKSIRDAHRLAPGAEFVVEDRPDGILLRPIAKPFAVTRLDDVLGCTGYRGPALSIEDMDAAIAAAARAEGVPPNPDRG